MGKTRHFRPEERSVLSAKPVANKPTKYKHDIYKVEDDEVDEAEREYFEELNAPDYSEF